MTTEGGAALAEKYPGKFIVNGRFDPRDGDKGLKRFEEEVKRYDIKGVKLYTAEWHGDSKGWKLTDPMSKKYFDKCAELGVVNIHVHKGPTIRPLNMDAFDVRDVDEVATEYLDAGLRFVVEHCGLPRIGDLPDTTEAQAYLTVRAELGLDCSPDAPVITDAAGREATDIDAHIRAARLVRVSTDGNTAFCRGVFQTRYQQHQGTGRRGTHH